MSCLTQFESDILIGSLISAISSVVSEISISHEVCVMRPIKRLDFTSLILHEYEILQAVFRHIL